jgi:hypothetical protein
MRSRGSRFSLTYHLPTGLDASPSLTSPDRDRMLQPSRLDSTQACQLLPLSFLGATLSSTASAGLGSSYG